MTSSGTGPLSRMRVSRSAVARLTERFGLPAPGRSPPLMVSAPESEIRRLILLYHTGLILLIGISNELKVHARGSGSAGKSRLQVLLRENAAIHADISRVDLHPLAADVGPS